MRIPEIQERLRELAGELACAELEALAGQLSRRSPAPRSNPTSTPMTEEMRDAIRAYHRAHPKLPQVDVARVFNVNQGRVSEALRGFRE